MIEGDRGESFVNRGYALNTSNVGTMLLGPVESFIALIAICRTISLFVDGSSAVNISYALRRGTVVSFDLSDAIMSFDRHLLNVDI